MKHSCCTHVTLSYYLQVKSYHQKYKDKMKKGKAPVCKAKMNKKRSQDAAAGVQLTGGQVTLEHFFDNVVSPPSVPEMVPEHVPHMPSTSHNLIVSELQMEEPPAEAPSVQDFKARIIHDLRAPRNALDVYENVDDGKLLRYRLWKMLNDNQQVGRDTDNDSVDLRTRHFIALLEIMCETEEFEEWGKICKSFVIAILTKPLLTYSNPSFSAISTSPANMIDIDSILHVIEFAIMTWNVIFLPSMYLNGPEFDVDTITKVHSLTGKLSVLSHSVKSALAFA